MAWLRLPGLPAPDLSESLLRQGLAQVVNTHCRTLRKPHDQIELPADCFDVTPQRGKMHISLVFDLRNRWLLDVQCDCNIDLSLAGYLAKLAQTIHPVAERPIRVMVLAWQSGDRLCNALCHDR